MTITIYPIAGIFAMICLWIGKKIGESPDMKEMKPNDYTSVNDRREPYTFQISGRVTSGRPSLNSLELEHLMNEKHTLWEWLVLFRKHPELREEFDRLTPPKPIE